MGLDDYTRADRDNPLLLFLNSHAFRVRTSILHNTFCLKCQCICLSFFEGGILTTVNSLSRDEEVNTDVIP